MAQMDLFDDDDAEDFLDAVEQVATSVDGMNVVLAFAACGSVALDCLHEMLDASDEESQRTALLVSNEFHAEFLALMSAYGYTSDTTNPN